MSILKLFLDTFVSFFEKGGNYYLPFKLEYNGLRFIDDNFKNGKKMIGESSTIILSFNYSYFLG